MSIDPLAPKIPRNRRGLLPFGLALLAFAAALATLRTSGPDYPTSLTITAGPMDTTRAVVATTLAAEISARGIETRVVGSGGTLDKLGRIDAGEIDFALVSGALRADRFTHVREVAPLYTEALHLLVKQELAPDVARGFAALRGKVVNFGLAGSSTDGLAKTVLSLADNVRFDGSEPAPMIARHEDPGLIDDILSRGGRAALPDVVFDLATLPSKIALDYVHKADYRLVAVPFADAFRLSAMISDEAVAADGETVERLYTLDTTIPAFTYRIEPPVPEQPLHTLGVPLMLVTHEGVSARTVEQVLETVFDSRFARMHQPPLERSLLAMPARLPLHPGALSFRQRDKPMLTQDDVEALSNGFSVVGALVGGGLFLWQAWRQRRQSRRDELFGGYLVRVADVERGVAELELASTIDLEALIALQRDLLRIKATALEDFAGGRLGGQAALFDLLGPINGARDHIAQLLLHVRETLEARAESEGRMAEDLWAEASESTEAST